MAGRTDEGAAGAGGPSWAELEAYLCRTLGGAAVRVLHAEAADGRGRHYRLDLDWPHERGPGGGGPGGANVVQAWLRLEEPAQLAAGYGLWGEFSVLQALSLNGAPVPEPLVHCDDPEPLGAAFNLTRRVPGNPGPAPPPAAAPHSPAASGAAAGPRAELLNDVAQALARTHEARPPLPGLEHLEPPEPGPALSAVYACQLELDRLPVPRPALEWGLRQLERMAPAREAVSLCHGDFHAGRLLVRDGRLAAVVGWTHARLGDPLEDLGSFCARCWRFGREELSAGGLGARETFLDAYEAAAGVEVDRDRLPYWELMAAVRRALRALGEAGDGKAGEDVATVVAAEHDVLDQLDAIRSGGGFI